MHLVSPLCFSRYPLSYLGMLLCYFAHFVVLLLGTLISVPLDLCFFYWRKAKGLLKPPSNAENIWLFLLILAFPSLIFYPLLAYPSIESLCRNTAFAITASPQDKLNKGFRESLHDNYNFEEIETCLNRGADINLCGSGGTALMLAAGAGDEYLVTDLLRRGADVNLSDWRGNTALIYALTWRKEQLHLNTVKKRIALALVQHGANLSPVLDAGKSRAIPVNTPLNAAIRSTGDIELIAKLLDAGAPVDGQSDFHKHRGVFSNAVTPLMTAAEMGNNEVVKLLLARGTDISGRCADSTDQKKQLESKDETGRTALYYALSSRKLDTAKLLISRGSNVNAKDACGTSVIMFTAGFVEPEYFELLLKAGATVDGENRNAETTLSGAARRGDLKRFERLITLGAKVDPNGMSGMRALWEALEGNNPGIVKLLIQKGVDVNGPYPFPKSGNMTILKDAKNKGNREIIGILREAGAKDEF
jgi:ankyrin repeat protein